MHLHTATSLLALVATPALTRGFAAVRPVATRTATSLAARRSLFPILRQRDLLFPSFDRMFEEMDEMMESSLATTGFRRPSLSLLSRDIPGELKLRRPLGFEVTQDDTEYKVAVHVPDVEAKDIDLQLDHDGRVLRLKGDRTTEDGGMKVQSRFEKAILLSPDVDTTKLSANLSGDTLTVVAPKIERKEALDKATNHKIDIKVVEQPTAKLEGNDAATDTDTTPKSSTKLAVENLKNEKVEAETKQTVDGDEKKWPSRDFPY